MKKVLVSTIACLLTIGALAQGTVVFVNLVPASGVNAPIFLANGTTRLDGATFQAELLAGTTAGSLSPVAVASFLSGGNAGIFNGGTITLAGIPGTAPAFFQVRAWNTGAGATYAQALTAGLGGMENAYGSSDVFSLTPGNPNGSPPSNPAALVGLTSFTLNPVPEPSTFVLAGLGIASLLLFRRRK